ncbi:sprouty-related, EVH1 domain-containing protein 2-like isoform X4 [Varroa jacobsoni]|uniref:sprouty-related, EVH1 domain-containing protein 2-like isoform X4 n=1 Tax=Varroa jacobsoni TaxID=62625 RepID=UPI000BF9E238|nr:sprouty-related, EVH1 domain-containing protein 2-like isoform X4 [Varroa jacobsoni]
MWHMGNGSGSGNVSANCLVRVRAQVMVRDDSTGGWVPMGGGGLSQVSVRKRLTLIHNDDPHGTQGSHAGPSAPGAGGSNCASYTTDYQIYGKRLTDQFVVLSCAISKDFTYNKVMPTFHHWKSGDNKFGLTFQTSSDAKAFDKAIHSAIDDLFDRDDDVFMALELPLDSRSSTTSSNGTSSSSSTAGLAKAMLKAPRPAKPLSSGAPPPAPVHGGIHHHNNSNNPANHSHFHRISYLNPTRPVPAPPVASISSVSGVGGLGGGTFSSSDRDPKGAFGGAQGPADKDSLCSYHSNNYNYGHITAAQHDYTYIDSNQMQSIQPGASGKKPALLPPSRSPSTLPLPIKKKGGSTVGKPDGRFGGERMAVLHCRHCLEEFRPEENVRGACEFGPDPVMGAIERASCMPCVECVLYHCWRDDDEAGAPRRPSSRRWAALAILSVIVPCLWLYYPLKACHRCGQSCALCGARHEA